MQIERPICFLDVESSGVDVVSDRIIEFGVCVLFPDGRRNTYSMRFNPGIPIPPAASEIHGITDADVADCPPFAEHAAKIHRALQGKDIAGYNVRFDLTVLDQEVRRCGLKLDLQGVRIIDAMQIFRRKEERTLAAAVIKYCLRTHDGAHGALADAEATADVLDGQMRAYPDLAAMSLDQLAEFCLPDGGAPVDLAGKLHRTSDGSVCYSFGKYKGRRVREVPSYADWMLIGGFPGSTCDALREELARPIVIPAPAAEREEVAR